MLWSSHHVQHLGPKLSVFTQKLCEPEKGWKLFGPCFSICEAGIEQFLP